MCASSSGEVVACDPNKKTRQAEAWRLIEETGAG